MTKSRSVRAAAGVLSTLVTLTLMAGLNVEAQAALAQVRLARQQPAAAQDATAPTCASPAARS